MPRSVIGPSSRPEQMGSDSDDGPAGGGRPGGGGRTGSGEPVHWAVPARQRGSPRQARRRRRLVSPQRQQPHRSRPDEGERVEVLLAVASAADETPVQAGRREAVAVSRGEAAQHVARRHRPAALDRRHDRLVRRAPSAVEHGDDRLATDGADEADRAGQGRPHRLPGAPCEVHAAMPRRPGAWRRLEAPDDLRLGRQRPHADGLIPSAVRGPGETDQQHEDDDSEDGSHPSMLRGAESSYDRAGSHLWTVVRPNRLGMVPGPRPGASTRSFHARPGRAQRFAPWGSLAYDVRSSPPGLTSHARRPRRNAPRFRTTRGRRPSVPTSSRSIGVGADRTGVWASGLPAPAGRNN
ncbi:hypothetical protein NOCA110187 [metagenome]|uniref:Uncharacterized protein n=1 Tax=metagenome TaxID=256318 RepID=A0A2P2C2K8_9ZZZZ